VMAHGWEGKIKPERTLPKHLEHLLGVNHIRVAVELGAKAAGWQLSFFFAHWELEAGGWPHQAIPDAACELIIDGQAEMILFEFDRCTEGKQVIKGKLEPYSRGLTGVPFSQVVFVAETAARVKQLARIARESGMSARFAFISRDDLTPLNLLQYFAPPPVASPVAPAQRVMHC
jgi:hypothetical protein